MSNLASKLQLFTGQITSFVKDSLEFIHKIHNLDLDEDDIIVSYDAVSRFIKIHNPESLDLIYKMVDVDTLKLLETSLPYTLFIFKGNKLNADA